VSEQLGIKPVAGGSHDEVVGADLSFEMQTSLKLALSIFLKRLNVRTSKTTT
jgi:hypothetical protein